MVSRPAKPATPQPCSEWPYFYHPDAGAVALSYGANAVRLNADAALLLQSILASCGIAAAELTSTLRTYHDQARITLTQTFVDDPAKVARWYGDAAHAACVAHADDIAGLARWWEQYDRARGAVSSKHLTNRAMDVVPSHSREVFARQVAALVEVAGSGVRRIIPQGTMGEPVDHVEFEFDVT